MRDTAIDGTHQVHSVWSGSSNSNSVVWTIVHYCLHVIAVYLSALVLSPLLVGWFYRWIAPILNLGITSSEVQFYFSHLFFSSVVPALLAGYINSKYRNGSAMCAWIIPTALLAEKVVTFPATSVFASKWAEAAAYYFSSNWQVPASIDEAFRGNIGGMRVYVAQTKFVAPFYAGLAYSVGALVRKFQMRSRMSHVS